MPIPTEISRRGHITAHGARLGGKAWRGERDRREHEPRREGKRGERAAMRARGCCAHSDATEQGAAKSCALHWVEGYRNRPSAGGGCVSRAAGDCSPEGEQASKQGGKREPPPASKERPESAAESNYARASFGDIERRQNLSERKKIVHVNVLSDIDFFLPTRKRSARQQPIVISGGWVGVTFGNG